MSGALHTPVRHRIVVLGSGFGGFTAALALKACVEDRHDVVVYSSRGEFLFTPSLIWVPFGLREKKDIIFSLAPVYASKGIHFVETAVRGIDVEARALVTAHGVESYDYLVIATGAKPDYAAIRGLGPRGFTHSILSWQDAERARLGFDDLVENPGPVVIGAVQGASSFLPAYEVALNLAHQLHKRHVEVPITFVTPEPYVGHLGLGLGPASSRIAQYFEKYRIQPVTSARVHEVQETAVILSDGTRLPFRYSILMPPLVGVDAVRSCTSIVDGCGFVQVNDCYHAERHPEVFAAGDAMRIGPVQATEVPMGVPRSGRFAEETAKIVAHNVVAQIRGRQMITLPPGELETREVLDAGDGGLILLAEHFLDRHETTWFIPGPEAHWAKVAWEKLFLARRRRGHI